MAANFSYVYLELNDDIIYLALASCETDRRNEQM